MGAPDDARPDPGPVSTITAAGFALATVAWTDDAGGEAIMRRYLDDEELAALVARRPRARQQTLLGRIAAKDAVCHHLAKHRGLEVDPIAVAVVNDEAGRPLIDGGWAGDLRLSIAHTATIGVAMVADGIDVGIDIEPIDPRSERFELLTLTDVEQRLPPVPGDDRDAWLTRLWAAKEACAKATGQGLGGRPKDFRVSEADGTRLLVNGRWIMTDRYRAADLSGYVVAWTLIPKPL
jgi:phosphopantetheinyl transferase